LKQQIPRKTGAACKKVQSGPLRSLAVNYSRFSEKGDLPFSSTISLMRAIMHAKMGMQIDLVTLRVAAVSIWQSNHPPIFSKISPSVDFLKIKNWDLV
jgi:hypothetical protein